MSGRRDQSDVGEIVAARYRGPGAPDKVVAARWGARGQVVPVSLVSQRWV